MAEYLDYRLEVPASETRKTEIWGVYSKSNGALLGAIRWFGRWRQYVFCPEDETVWNPDCLNSVSAFTAALTKKHRQTASA